MSRAGLDALLSRHKPLACLPPAAMLFIIRDGHSGGRQGAPNVRMCNDPRGGEEAMTAPADISDPGRRRPHLHSAIAGAVLLVLPYQAAQAFEFPIDSDGYGQHLRELCLIKARVAMPGTSFSASHRFCSLYFAIPMPLAASCAEALEPCTRRFLSDYFNVRLSRPIDNLTRCDDRGCAVYYNFRDAENLYESATECGFDIGGIARADKQGRFFSLVSVSINRNCLRDG
jgi:hypothetical protein